MKRKTTVKHPDGTTITKEEHDEAPAMHMSKAKAAATAAEGQRGDTQLAHVNQWEEELLKRLGGAGTRNPHTGLKQFYTGTDEWNTWNIQPESWMKFDSTPAPAGYEYRYNPQTNERKSVKSCDPQIGGVHVWGAGAPTVTGTGTNPDPRFQTTAGGGTGGNTGTTQVPISPTPASPLSTPGQLTSASLLGGDPTARTYSPPGTSTDFGANSNILSPGQLNSLSLLAGGGSQSGTGVGSANRLANTGLPVQGGNGNGVSYQPIDPATGLPKVNYQVTDQGGAPVPMTQGPGNGNPNIDMTTGQPIAAAATGGTTGTTGTTAPPQINSAANPYPNSTIAQDFASYFSTAQPGSVIAFGNGTLTMGANGQATYTNPTTGETYSFAANTPLSTIYASSPGIKAAFDNVYGPKTSGGPTYDAYGNVVNTGGTTGTTATSGTTPATGAGTTPTATAATTGADDFFNLPLDIMPTSYSGLPQTYQDQLLASLMPQLNSAVTNMPGNIDKYTNEALGSYQQMMQNALRQNIPEALRGLANRGILNSTEGQNVLGNVMSTAATDASTKGYTTAMQAALLKANMPTILAQIADLGKSSTSQDPTQMYKTMADLIKAMM
jgi:hypothetical protein